MKTITITSQGQITIPAAIRKAWGITGSQELDISYDDASRTMAIRKPLSLDEALAAFDAIPRRKVKPLTNIHEYYEAERTKEIVARMKENE